MWTTPGKSGVAMQNDAPSQAPAAAAKAVTPPGFAAPGACADMGSLRVAIDALDRHLVALLALRQGYMERAAVLKPRRELVRDEPRVEDVVQKVLAEAARQGLSPAIAEPVWRTLIERCIAHELAAFDRR
jgi:isochorismate pyruvate lyase